VYRVGRVADQQQWYTSKSLWNRKLSTIWFWIVIAAESLGALGGLVKATGIVTIDVIGIFSAVVAGGVAWLQSKKYDMLAASYAVASQELSEIASRVNTVVDEEDWANFVDQAEEAISREHTMWLASRTR
jgi:hypothetical protein